MQFDIESRKNFLQNFASPDYEPFQDLYLNHLDNLNQIIKDIGEPLEGNIFYQHLNPTFSHDLERYFLPKRRLIALLGITSNQVMEIGFNSGYSALLLLVSNPRMHLTCIDLCVHKYTVPCFEYLKKNFGDRIELIQSNSLLAFGMLNATSIDYDTYIVDGGHGLDTAEADLNNVISYGSKGSRILFDDTDMKELRLLVSMYMTKGKIINVSDSVGILHNSSHMLFLNNK